jgi:hypothetical protein
MVRTILLERNRLGGILRKNTLGLDFFVGLCFYVGGPEDAAAAPPDPCRQPPAVGPLPTATSKH